MKTTARHRLVVVGILAAILAEGCSVALLAASGWFLAASAIAGLTAGSVFSYIAPSGWVRAFAIGRIALQYAQRLLLHRAALERTGESRSDFFRRSAASGTAEQDGALLERAVHDTDTVGLSLITVLAPLWAFLGVLVGAALALLVASPVALVPFLAFAILAVFVGVVLDRWSARTTARVDTAREGLSAEIVDVAVAWPEMVSLGAAGAVRGGLEDRLRDYDAARRSRAGRFSVSVLAVGVVFVLAILAAVAIPVLLGGAPVPDAVLIFLLLTGVSGSAAALPGALAQRRVVRAAQRRLEAATVWNPTQRTRPRVRLAPDAVLVDEYTAPETALRPAVPIALALEPGDVVAVTGASGAGKSTFLEGLGIALRETAGGLGTVRDVPVDDYVFTGTVSENLRLGAPGADDLALSGALETCALGDLGLETAVGVGGRELSGGELTRLRLARALAAAPSILLVDEPTAGLDTDTARAVLDGLCARTKSGVLVVAVHDEALLREAAGPRLQTIRL